VMPPPITAMEVVLDFMVQISWLTWA